jgi:hypothetical protein
MTISLLMLAARIALAACLYAFLAVMLIVLWRDVRSAGPHPDSAPAHSLRRLREDGTPEKTFPLLKESCFIGRSPSLEVPLADDTVSVVHARLWKQHGRWWLEDLDSRNGVLLNRIPVAKKTVLCAGDRIQIGRVLLEFHAEDSSGAPPEPRKSPRPGPSA